MTSIDKNEPNAQKQIEDIRHMRSISRALKSTGIKNSRVACHILLLVACIVNILMSMSSKWHDLESRILCLRDLQSLLLILIYFIIMGQDGRVLEKFCDIMDEQFSGRIEIQQFDEINRNFRVANSLNVKKYCRNFLIFLLVRNSAMAFVPMIYSILLVISAVMKDDYEKLNHLPVIINFHYPERHACWQLQLALNLFATYFYVINIFLSYIFTMSGIFIFHNISYHFELLSSYIQEFDKLELLEDIRLKFMMKQLTAYHQTILRIHSNFDEHCRFLIFGFSFAVTFQACTYIYSIVEMRESKYVIQLSFALVLLYAFSIYGQKIVDAVLQTTYTYFNFLKDTNK